MTRPSKRELKRALEELRGDDAEGDRAERWVHAVVEQIASGEMRVAFPGDDVDGDTEAATEDTDGDDAGEGDEEDVEYVTIARSDTEEMAFTPAVPREAIPEFIDVDDDLPVHLT